MHLTGSGEPCYHHSKKQAHCLRKPPVHMYAWGQHSSKIIQEGPHAHIRPTNSTYIEQNDAGVANKRTGQRDSLPLPTRQLRPARSDLRENACSICENAINANNKLLEISCRVERMAMGMASADCPRKRAPF